MSSKRVIVTGGAGYIGSHIVKELKGKGYEVGVLDNLSRGKLEWAEKAGMDEFFEVDILNFDELKDVFEKYRPFCVMHLAAKVSVEEGEKKKAEYWNVNFLGSKNVFEVAKLVEAKVVFSSSASVYGDWKSGAFKEEDFTKPVSCYAKTKMAGEYVLFDFHSDAVALRYFNVIGFDKSLGMHLDEGGLPANIVLSLKTGKKFKIYGNDWDTKDGTPVRDFVDVRDVARAHIFVLERILMKKGEGMILNCGTGRGVSVLEVCEKIREEFNEFEWEFAGRRKADLGYVIADVSKINALGWRATYSPVDEFVRVVKELLGE